MSSDPTNPQQPAAFDVSQVPIPVLPPVAFIGTTTRYFNEQGHQIEERTCVEGHFPATYPRFIGFAVLCGHENGEMMEIPLTFPIRASNYIEAFAYYEQNRDRAKAAEVKRRHDEAMDAAAPQIITRGG